MPYLVLAAGALMTIAGFYAVVTGYGVVQLEQGWSAVIAGATLIAGGVVTMAMAMLLRALNQIRAGLVGATVSPDEAIEPPSVETASLPAVVPVTKAAVAQTLPEPVLPAAPALAEAPPSPSMTAALEPDPVPDPPADPIAAPKAALPRSPIFPAAPAPVAPAEPALRFSEKFKPAAPTLTTKPTPDPEPKLDDVPPPPERYDEARAQKPEPPHVVEDRDAPPMDDWLDRAFAEFDQTVPEPKPHPAPVHEPAYAEAPPPAAAEPVAPVVHDAPAPTPAEPDAPTSAVIGRYEADGTSYVMYADGSIEAQSEAGVYRFASMAELKAFIET